jgi:hypothetical protein
MPFNFHLKDKRPDTPLVVGKRKELGSISYLQCYGKIQDLIPIHLTICSVYLGSDLLRENGSKVLDSPIIQNEGLLHIFRDIKLLRRESLKRNPRIWSWKI